MGELQDRIEQIDRQDEQNGERFAGLEELVTSLRHDLENFAAQESASSMGVWVWPEVTDPDERRAKWTLLRQFIIEVLSRYPNTVDTLKPCWFRHTWAVDVLTALYISWLEAYKNPDASKHDASFWQEQRLPNATSLLAQALTDCKIRECGLSEGNEQQRITDIRAATGERFTDFVRVDVQSVQAAPGRS